MSGDNKRKPLITANRVTMIRLLPMPLIAWMIYLGPTITDQTRGLDWLWTVLIVATIIACTDFVDGFLARKYGPTVLGGLLDPMTDKIFIALTYLPFTDLGFLPWWAVALLFTREFLVTAIRSAFKLRGLSMKTSYFAKVKTWVQMQGIGVIALLFLLERDALLWAMGVGVGIAVVALIAYFAVKRRLWRGAVLMALLVGAAIPLCLPQDPIVATRYLMYGVVAITWASGLDYLVAGIPKLRASGDFDRADAVRILSALSLPVLSVANLVWVPDAVIPVLAIVSLELSVGGLDNLLSHHQVAAKARLWAARALGAAALLGAALLCAHQQLDTIATALSWAAMVVCTIGVAVEFYRGRDYYMSALSDEVGELLREDD